MAASLKFDERELKKTLKTMKSLDIRLQKKVWTQSVNATTRKVVLPAVRANINARSTDVYFKPYPRRGLHKPMLSHTTPPGALKKYMKVKAIKRTRTAVGRLVVTPTRAEIGQPEGYPGYYPAHVEYNNSPYGTTKPYLRPVFPQKKKAIERFFNSDARKRIQKLRFT